MQSIIIISAIVLLTTFSIQAVATSENISSPVENCENTVMFPLFDRSSCTPYTILDLDYKWTEPTSIHTTYNTLVEHMYIPKTNIISESNVDSVVISSSRSITESRTLDGYSIPSSPITTVSYPKHVQIGETFLINYTYAWFETDSDTNEQKPLEFVRVDNYTSITLDLYLPDEFVVTKNQDIQEYNAVADLYTPHVLKRYAIEVPIDITKVNHGSVEVRLDTEMMYDEDYALLYGGWTGLGAFIIKEENGIRFASEDEIGRMACWSCSDDMNRYTTRNIPETGSFTPYPKPNAFYGASGDPEPIYIKRDQVYWNGFAEFLRSVKLNQNIQNMTQWLLENNLSPKFIDDFFLEYPEFKIQNTSGVIGAQSSSPLIFVHGNLSTSKDIDLVGVTACLYDIDSNKSNPTLLYRESYPACVKTSPTGSFSIIAINDDPNDDTGVDFYLNFSLANDNVAVHDQYDKLLIHTTDVQRDANQNIYKINTSVNPGEFVDYYSVFADINMAHKKIRSDVRYDVPFVVIQDYPAQNYAAYIHSDNSSSTIRSGSIGGQSILVNSSSSIMHEYGHHIQHEIYHKLNGEPPECLFHSLRSTSTYECAWAEGWAWFVAAWIYDTPQLQTRFLDKVNFETGEYTDNFKTSSFPYNDNQISEGWVTAALWDMYDSINERGDTVSNGLRHIWDAFDDSAAQNINQFKTEWDKNGSPSINDIFELDHIPFRSLIFSASLESDLNRINVIFNQRITHDFAATDFRISNGTITSVINFADSDTRHLRILDVPYGTPIKVTYVGESKIFGSSLLAVDTANITNAVSPPIQIIAPSDILKEATGHLTKVFLGTPDLINYTNIKVTNNAPTNFTLGTHVITWTARDYLGNTASDTQIVIIQDTTSPTITVPSNYQKTIKGDQKNLTPRNYGLATATDLVDTNPVITNNASVTFPLGITTIQWTATDASGNIATATQEVILSKKATKLPSKPVLSSTVSDTDVTLCVEDPQDNSIIKYTIVRTDATVQGVINVNLDTGSPALCYIDSTIKSSNTYNYTIIAQNDLGNSPRSDSVTVKLVGQSIPPHTPILLSNSTVVGNQITLCVQDPTNPHITGYSIWERDIEKSNSVLLRTVTDTGSSDLCYTHTVSKNSTYVFRVVALVDNLQSFVSNKILAQVGSSLVLEATLLNNTFDTSLGRWSYTQQSIQWAVAKWCNNVNLTTYELTHSNVHGGSAYLSYTNGCWFGHAGAVKTFKIPPTTGNTLHVSLDFQALSNAPYSNSFYLTISDSEDTVLLGTRAYYGGDVRYGHDDSGVLSKSFTISPFNATRCPCQASVYLLDAWKTDWNQRFYFDNVTATVTTSISGVSTDHNELKLQEYLSMHLGNGTRIEVTHKSSETNSAFFDWNNFKDAAQYTLEIYPVDDPTGRKFYNTTSSEYRFMELQSNTEYIVTISKTSDPSTSVSLAVITDP